MFLRDGVVGLYLFVAIVHYLPQFMLSKKGIVAESSVRVTIAFFHSPVKPA